MDGAGNQRAEGKGVLAGRSVQQGGVPGGRPEMQEGCLLEAGSQAGSTHRAGQRPAQLWGQERGRSLATQHVNLRQEFHVGVHGSCINYLWRVIS